jgi:glycosyltransferase involved in cell wall biosynthesis
MRVAIAQHFHESEWMGGRNYFASLLRAVHLVAPDEVEFILVTGKGTRTTIPAELPWLKVRHTSVYDRLSAGWILRQIENRSIGTDYLLQRNLASIGVDILSHGSHLSAYSPVKTLPWLYDFQFLHYPEYWEKSLINWYKARYTQACKSGTALIVSSHDALNDLNSFAPWCTKPKHVLQFVSNPVLLADLPNEDVIRSKYHITGPYFHVANQFWMNKNHRVLIDALAKLRDKGVQATIVCTGRTQDTRRPDYFQELMNECRRAKVDSDFRVLGVVPYQDLQALMLFSRAVINPSFFEGWNTAVEEAKTMMKDLILSDIGVHREQADGRAAFFNPLDSDALAGCIIESLDNESSIATQEDIEKNYNKRLAAFGSNYLKILNSIKAV